MHSLLARQLRKSGLLPADVDSRLLAMVEAAYVEYDDDRRMLERSLELSSRELLEANSEMRALLGSLPDLFLRMNGEGLVTDCRGPAPTAYFTRGDVLGHTLAELVAPPWRAALLDAFESVQREGRQGTVEYEVVDAGGKVRYLEARLARTLEAQVVALVRDITTTKSAEAAQAARNDRLQRQQAALHELALAEGSDPEGAVGRACVVAAETLGAARASVWYFDPSRARITCAWLFADGRLHASPDLALEASTYPRYFAAIEQQPTVAAADAHADPRTSEFAASWLAPHGIGAMLDCAIRVGGRSVGVLSVQHVGGAREWTLEDQDFASAVASFVALSVSLEQRRNLEAQLRHSQKMEAVGMLAGGIAHDFNNLLTAILGFAELLRSNRRLDPVAHSHASEIALAGRRATELIAQLLAFSRKQPLVARPVFLGDIVRDTSRLLGRVVGEAIALQVDIPPEDAVVRVDSNQIEQVLMNLVVNARDAMPDHRGAIGIRVRRQVVGPDAHGAVAPGEWGVLEVEDTGIGIPAEHLGRVFEPFFTTKEVGEGSGLGLAIVYGLVQQNGGHVEVVSTPGKGTTARVFLPLDPTGVSDATTVRRGVEDDLQGGDETILLVEDEEIVRVLAVELLQRLGYQVLVASRPSEALLLVQVEGEVIDLMVTDLVMPEMSGADLYRRAAEVRPGLRVLYMSGYAPDTLLRAAAVQTGINFLAKPFTLRQLADAVRDAMGHAGARATG